MATASFEFDVDDVTLARARRGDLRALESIYRQFQKPVFTVIARVVNCRQLAQDVSQETFITAFRRLNQFRGDASFWSWLKRVAVNHAISALRRLPKVDVVTFDDYQASVEGEQQALGQAMDLEAALQQLSATDRTVVWLHDVEGYKHSEIAELFDKTESFSKTRLARARAQLRALIQTANAAGVAESTASVGPGI
jgi:RNA polymerase sigma-70 factor (ECF subfamily)